MKSYNHLYEKLVENDNIKLAIKNSSRGKRNRNSVKEVFENQDKYVEHFRDMASVYRNASHKPKPIYDGIRHKRRTIIVPMYYEQVMHHMIVNTLKPIMLKSMYEHSYGSIPNKGSFLGRKFIKKWLTNDIKNTRYCLQMDVQKFFDSVAHDVLKDKLSNLIHDDRFLKVLFEIIDVQEVGLPLGFYTSQWLANFYLTALDHYIKEKLQAKYYVRYMDDMVIFDGNRKTLFKMQKEIERYLNEELKLQMKPNWKIFRVGYTDKNGNDRGKPLDFMGYKFYHHKVTLRKSIMIRACRVARRLSRKEKPTIFDCRRMLSYLGWIKSTNTYNMYLKHIKPYINFQNLKRRISRFDRRLVCGNTQNMIQSQA